VSFLDDVFTSVDSAVDKASEAIQHLGKNLNSEPDHRNLMRFRWSTYADANSKPIEQKVFPNCGFILDEDSRLAAGKDMHDTRAAASIFTRKADSVEQPDTETIGDIAARAARLAFEQVKKTDPEVTQASHEEVRRRDAHAADRLLSNPEVKAEHDRFHSKLEGLKRDHKITEAQAAAMEANMQKFEAREAEQQAQYRNELQARGMKLEDAETAAQAKAQTQIQETYRNIERLLEKNSRAPIPETDRIMLAQQCLQHAADTKTISQGNHGSCYAAAVETRTYERDSVAATRLIADVATTGSYTTKSEPAVTVHIDRGSLAKHDESHDKEQINGRRDYASQIFQLTAANIHYEMQNAAKDPPGKLRFEMRDRNPGRNGDTGERLYDYAQKDPKTGRAPKEVVDSDGMNPGLTIHDSVEVTKSVPSPIRAG